MLRRALEAAKNPSQASGSGSDGRMGSPGQHDVILKKRFKSPFRQRQTNAEGKRKRNDIDYSRMGGDSGGRDDDEENCGYADSDDDGAGGASVAKKAKKGKGKPITFESFKNVGPNGEALIKIRHFAKFETKDKAVIHRQFTIPAMTTKSGEIVRAPLSGMALGARRSEVPPRPLFDPMGEHLIVLWDPTKDDKEAEAEKQRRQQEQEEMEKRLESKEDLQLKEAKKAHQTVHKSLADILKIKKRSHDDIPAKVPVCVDPRLGKILRPHQIEGVKVRVVVVVEVW